MQNGERVTRATDIAGKFNCCFTVTDSRYHNYIANCVKWENFDNDDGVGDVTTWLQILSSIFMFNKGWFCEQFLRWICWETMQISKSYFYHILQNKIHNLFNSKIYKERVRQVYFNAMIKQYISQSIETNTKMSYILMGMLLWQLRVGMDVNLYDNLHSAAWSKSA